MAHIATKIDFSSGNVRFQIDLLGRAVREHGPLPLTKYIEYAIWKRDEDIRETGNEHRFDRHHPVLSRELKAWEREQLTATTISPVIAPTSAPTTTTTTSTGTPKPPIACDHAAVPEPPSWALLALGFGLIWAAILVRERHDRRPGGFGVHSR